MERWRKEKRSGERSGGCLVSREGKGKRREGKGKKKKKEEKKRKKNSEVEESIDLLVEF